MNNPFIYVEDLIEFIGGYRSSDNIRYGIFDTRPAPISLARYDVNIVDSFSQQSQGAISYTDKQAELAVKIVSKYTKQLAKLGVTVPADLSNFKLGIRQIDRTQSLHIENSKLIFRFPYNTTIINQVKEYTKQAQGKVEFNREEKYWELALTEPNLNWAYTVAELNKFEISLEVKNLFDLIIKAGSETYEIKLITSGDQYIITNAATSLIEYIESNLGGFSKDNLLQLIDAAPVLGYTVDPELLNEFNDTLTDDQLKLISSRGVKLKQANVSMETIIDYARLTNRLPIYVYDTNLKHQSNSTDIIYIQRNTVLNDYVKLLVTTAQLLIGPKKQAWLVKAEKVVYLE